VLYAEGEAETAERALCQSVQRPFYMSRLLFVTEKGRFS